MLSRVIHGARVPLAAGVSSVVFALFLGVPLGMIAGYYGGRLDSVIMRLMDLVLAFPVYLLAIILMIMFTPTAGPIGTIKVVAAIAIVRRQVEGFAAPAYGFVQQCVEAAILIAAVAVP